MEKITKYSHMCKDICDAGTAMIGVACTAVLTVYCALIGKEMYRSIKEDNDR